MEDKHTIFVTFILKPLLSVTVGSVTFIESVDLALRVLAAIASLVVAYWAVKSYRTRVLLDEEKRRQLAQNKKYEND